MEKSTLSPLGVKQSSQRPEPQERQAKQLDQLWTRRKNAVARNKSWARSGFDAPGDAMQNGITGSHILREPIL